MTLYEWQQILDGKKFAYFFLEFKYDVNGVTKKGEYCTFVTNDAPSMHFCIGHNQTIISQ